MATQVSGRPISNMNKDERGVDFVATTVCSAVVATCVVFHANKNLIGHILPNQRPKDKLSA